MIELDNERLRTRCAELAAEVERLQNVAEITNKELHRLQSVTDEANGQDPYRYIGNGKTLAYPNPVYENDAEWVPVYLRPIPAQQSPAVAVPDECCATGQSCAYEICTLNGEQQCKYCGKEHPDMQSPRITEQDFIEIIKSYMQVSIPFKVTFESWMSAEGRALLAKLNEANHGS